MKLPPELFDNMDHMVKLLHQQIETYSQLKRAFRLVELLGVAPSEIGVVRIRHIPSGRLTHPWKGAQLVVIRDDHEHTFALVDVHPDLWPEDVRLAYTRHLQGEARRNAKRGLN